MWAEKYRPQHISDLTSQQEVTKTLLGAIEQGQMPHLLFYGPPGTGKTTTILAVTRMLYHPSARADRVLEMNASDERGIKVVRDKIKSFAQRSVGAATFEGYPSPPFKIVILDEADTMTKDAQGALRRTMEATSNVTRFCLVCNYVSRVIEPLVSRCAKMRFSPLGADAMRGQLRKIAAAEGVRYGDAVYEKILEHSRGDLRRAVTLLQSCASFYGAASPVTPEALGEVSGDVPRALLDALWAAVDARNFAKVTAAVDGMMLEGLPALACLRTIHDDLVGNPRLADAWKAASLEELALVDKNLADGADHHLALHSFCSKLIEY